MRGRAKIIIILLPILFVSLSHAIAQMYQPVKWQVVAVQQDQSEVVSFVFTASLDQGWHLYSQFMGSNGPMPTAFSFEESKDYTLEGQVMEESTPVKSFDRTFQSNVIHFSGIVLFSQKVLLHKASAIVRGKVEYMVCNDEMCLPPDVFEFSVNAKTKIITDKTRSSYPEVLAEKKNQKEKEGDKLPQEPVATGEVEIKKPDTITAGSKAMVYKTSPSKDTSDLDNANANISRSLWSIFLGGVLGGLAAILMPCIFPMLPFTISYFTKRALSRKEAVGLAAIYGLSIIILYVSLGMIITLIFGSDALNDLSTNGVFNFAFFLLLIIFAASLLGAFEITLPSAWASKADLKSEQKGFWGIFFMAATLALVSFSCTGPIIGTLLVEAATMKDYFGPAVGMLGFSIALALPFSLFCLFPSWLQALPKSGGWLNSVKVVLGFLELALALKFLSNVDLAYHWQWFDREVFLVLWIIIFGLLGLYLLGKIKFIYDGQLTHLSPMRLFLAIIALAFTLYMIPGLWGAPLKVIAAFLPPQQTQDFDLYSDQLKNSGFITSINHSEKKYDEIFHAPYNINAFFDYEQGMAFARKAQRPVMIDFTGHACVNCRKMEAVVWSDPRILNRLQHDYVLIQLYVDDKTSLPEEEQTISSFSGKKIKTIGNKWSDFQASVYNANSQPYYVLLSYKGEPLTEPRGADYNTENFIQFLDEGLKTFTNKYQGREAVVPLEKSSCN